jgi:hypothetical protein
LSGNFKLCIENCLSPPQNNKKNGESESVVPWSGAGAPSAQPGPVPKRRRRLSADGAKSSWHQGEQQQNEGATVIWVAGAAAFMVAILSVAFPLWLVRREAARWRRFRQAQGEPEVVARRVAAQADRSRLAPIRLMVFRSSTNRWEPVGDIGRRRQSSPHDPARRRKRRPRGATVTCWPAIVLDAVTRF